MLQALGDVGKNFLNGRSIRRLLYQVDMLKKSAMFAADGAGKVPLGRVDLAVVQIHALFARELLPKNLQTAPVAFREGMKAIGLYEDVGKGFTFLLEAQALDTDEGLGFLLKRLPACGDGVPPMVVVPALELCQVGPSCRISCPAFSFRSSASTNLPRIMVSTQPASNAT